MTSPPPPSRHPDLRPALGVCAVHIGICAAVLGYNHAVGSRPSLFALVMVGIVGGVFCTILIVTAFPWPLGYRRLMSAKATSDPRVEVLSGTLRAAGEKLTAPLSKQPCLGYEVTVKTIGRNSQSFRQAALTRVELEGEWGEAVLTDGELHTDVPHAERQATFHFDKGIAALKEAAPSLLIKAESLYPAVAEEAVVMEGDVVTVVGKRARGTNDRYGAADARSRSLSGARVFAFTEAAARSRERFHALLMIGTVTAVAASTAAFMILAL